MTHTDEKKRHDFLMVFDVTMGNPNGDPDADNLPRIDPETMHGIVTDVCLKRKVRDYLAVVLKRPIFIQSKTALNTIILEEFKKAGYHPFEADLNDGELENEELMEWISANPGFDFEEQEERSEKNSEKRQKIIYIGESGKITDIRKQLVKDLEKSREELKDALLELGKRIQKPKESKKEKDIVKDKARSNLCAEYDDIRLFGAVLTTGLNAGQVRGPLQLTFARSVDPILPQSYTITRQARTTPARMETGQTEMGRKSAIPYGLYIARGYYNPFFAKETQPNDEDLKRFWEALSTMFEYDRSASRGEMVMHQVYVFTHENKKGNAHAHQLFKMVTDDIEKKPDVTYSRTIEDYASLPSKDEIEAKMTKKNINSVTLTLLNS